MTDKTPNLQYLRDSIRCMSAFLDDCAEEMGTPKGDPDALGEEIVFLKEAKEELYGIVYGMLDLHESEDIMGMDFKATASLLMDRARMAIDKYKPNSTRESDNK